MKYKKKIKSKKIIDSGKQTLKIEANAVRALISRIDENFVRAIKIILNCRGRVVVTGIGKSGVIGRKFSATLASTGTPSLFIHSAEGSHGDLGMIMEKDIIIAISYSGETDEISKLLPAIKRIGVKLISITGNINSTLAKYSDVVLNINVKKEACPMGLAPTASTTAALAMGDAIAVALINEKKINSKDFALFHPAGTLGKNLIVTVEDLMYTGQDIPVVKENTSLNNALLIMTSKLLGLTGVVNKNNKLTGIITDGDLRRIIAKYKDFSKLKSKEVMSKNPKTIKKSKLAAEALLIMNKYKITSLFILDNKKQPIGVIHMHSILNSGIG